MSSIDTENPVVADSILSDIADYVCGYQIASDEAYRMARYCVMDALGCAVEALNFPACTRLLGPIIPGSSYVHGARVPGTRFELDPVTATFNLGCMIRWLDFNDAFTAAQGGGHPSDNLGAVLATADYLSRTQVAAGSKPLLMRDVMTALIKCYEIQGVLSLQNDLPLSGWDYMPLPKAAVAAVVTYMLGGSREEIINAMSNAWVDGAPLNIYRSGETTGSRKSWAGGDAVSRGVWLALMARRGEMGYPTVLTEKKCGVYDALLQGKPLKVPVAEDGTDQRNPYSSNVIENVMFKLFPTVSFAQGTVECALKLHPLVANRLDQISSITIHSHNKLIENTDKRGPLANPAERDHCVQYVVAVGLIHGALRTSDFEEEFAADPRIDRLRNLMTVIEDPRYSRERMQPDKRSNANAVQVHFSDGPSTPLVEIEYPAGHPRCRDIGLTMVEDKFKHHLSRRFPVQRQKALFELFGDQQRFEALAVHDFVERFVS